MLKHWQEGLAHPRYLGLKVPDCLCSPTMLKVPGCFARGKQHWRALDQEVNALVFKWVIFAYNYLVRNSHMAPLHPESLGSTILPGAWKTGREWKYLVNTINDYCVFCGSRCLLTRSIEFRPDWRMSSNHCFQCFKHNWYCLKTTMSYVLVRAVSVFGVFLTNLICDITEISDKCLKFTVVCSTLRKITYF